MAIPAITRTTSIQANMETPASIEKDAAAYKQDAWKQYTPLELGNWVHLLVKRAGHRADVVKREKDLNDAQAYLDMLSQHINAARS